MKLTVTAIENYNKWDIICVFFFVEKRLSNVLRLFILTGNSNRDHLLGIVCGDDSKTYVSTGQEMLVVLKGDNNQTGRFLAAYYSEVKGEFYFFFPHRISKIITLSSVPVFPAVCD